MCKCINMSFTLCNFSEICRFLDQLLIIIINERIILLIKMYEQAEQELTYLHAGVNTNTLELCDFYMETNSTI